MSAADVATQDAGLASDFNSAYRFVSVNCDCVNRQGFPPAQSASEAASRRAQDVLGVLQRCGVSTLMAVRSESRDLVVGLGIGPVGQNENINDVGCASISTKTRPIGNGPSGTLSNLQVHAF